MLSRWRRYSFSLKTIRINRKLRALVLLVYIALFPRLVYSQDLPVSVSVNGSEFSTDDVVILTVTAINDSPRQPRPILPPLDGLSVIDLNIATNVSLVRGEIQTEVVYTYQLQPRRTGTLTIPPIPVKFNDEDVVETTPISFEVTQGAPPAPSPNHAVLPGLVVPPADLVDQDFYVEAVVDQASPYLGQQLIYTFRLYQAIRLYRQPQLEMPIFSSFETLGMPVQEYNLDVGDRTYLVSEIRTALFPKSTGIINIGTAQLIFPGSFFEEAAELYTQPIQLNVKPLPDDAPPEFTGAVGQFDMEAWFSPQVAVINQPSTLSVAISGVGNVNTLPDPIWPSLRQWRTYDSLKSQSMDLKNGQLQGTRVYERLVVWDKIGDFTIPPAKLVYFDPAAEEYRTISTKSLKMRVIAPPTPDAASATATAVAAIPIPATTPNNRAGSINPLINPAAPSFNSDFSDSLNSNWRAMLPMGVVLLWTICTGIPAAVVVGAGGLWLWQKRQEKSKIAAEAVKQPKEMIHPAIAQAMTGSDDNYQVASRALTGYLGRMLGASVKGLTRTELADRLQTHGLSILQAHKINDYLAQSEMGRYGPQTNDAGWELLAKVDKLLFELDKQAETKARAKK
ncbi:MAG: protein BatD [Anaerolineaceae bacterium]|nr:protein BatD [Anaerolineaceae bacterium]MCB9100224.1 protein BatD [Anaerolineales bacterium]